MEGSGRSNNIISKRKKERKSSVSCNREQKNKIGSDSQDISSEIEVTATEFAAALESVKSNRVNNDVLCKLCEKKAQTEDRWWQNIENPDKKLPAKLN